MGIAKPTCTYVTSEKKIVVGYNRLAFALFGITGFLDWQMQGMLELIQQRYSHA